jgi:hypothetical protein
MIKRTLTSISILALLLIFLTCCSSPIKTNDQNFIEKNINSLLDSTVFDRRRLVVPSPEDFKDSLSRKRLNERTVFAKNMILSPLTIVLKDSMKPISNLKFFFPKLSILILT